MVESSADLDLPLVRNVVCGLTKYGFVLLRGVIGQNDVDHAWWHADVESTAGREIIIFVLEKAAKHPAQRSLVGRNQIQFLREDARDAFVAEGQVRGTDTIEIDLLGGAAILVTSK